MLSDKYIVNTEERHLFTDGKKSINILQFLITKQLGGVTLKLKVKTARYTKKFQNYVSVFTRTI